MCFSRGLKVRLYKITERSRQITYLTVSLEKVSVYHKIDRISENTSDLKWTHSFFAEDVPVQVNTWFLSRFCPCRSISENSSSFAWTKIGLITKPPAWWNTHLTSFSATPGRNWWSRERYHFWYCFFATSVFTWKYGNPLSMKATGMYYINVSYVLYI